MMRLVNKKRRNLTIAENTKDIRGNSSEISMISGAIGGLSAAIMTIKNLVFNNSAEISMLEGTMNANQQKTDKRLKNIEQLAVEALF